MEKKFFLALLSASNAHEARAREEFAKLDLSSGQPKILFLLKRIEPPVQKDLAELCGINTSTLTVLLRGMEKKGLVEKEVCHVSGGKRAFKIRLTPKGEECAEKVEKLVNDLEEESFQNFSSEDKEILFSLLGRVENNLSK